jgi:ABC-2 type transport system ATP-binding protein
MIQLEAVTKLYAGVPAVEGVSFEVQPGEVVGFLGPNGAGKSTILKILSTWIRPSSGRARVAGFDVAAEPLAVREVLGYLPEHNPLYEGMRVDELLVFAARAHGLAKGRVQERLEWAVSSLSLQDVVKKRVSQCSKGYRQRIGLAAALIHDPQVILLDEPTHGLDPLQVVAFRQFVHGLAPGRAILFSSHVLAEVAAICERLLLLHHGRLIAAARTADLLAEAAGQGSDLERVVLSLVEARGGRELALRGGSREARR